ncbi:potassium channel family protein [Arhodomonas sp. SL1]|uniref:potassium channel family protein n=1 Tax=Arhodomonas sp. SL1 TaxID=3425691 RepID=UPI003F8847E6
MQEQTTTLAQALTSVPHWTVVVTTLILVGACVVIHYECLNLVWRRLVDTGIRHPPPRRMVVVILAMLGAHVAEIWLFALGYHLLLILDGTGALTGTPVTSLLDYVYFSAVTYTTLGFGDITPEGAVRMLVGTEAITGLALVTWSASMAFLAMQREW